MSTRTLFGNEAMVNLEKAYPQNRKKGKFPESKFCKY